MSKSVKKIFSIAAPIIGGMFGGPIGAAIGGAVGGGISGGAKGALLGGALSYAGSSLLGGGGGSLGTAGSGASAMPLFGGLDGALGDSVANYASGMGANNLLTGAGSAIGGLGAPVTDLTSASMLPGVTNYAPGVLNSGATMSITGGPFSVLNSLLQKVGMGGVGGGGAGGGGGIFPGSSPILNGMNVASGLYGMYQQNEMRELAERAASQQDPFGGQRGQYAQMLQQLYADPSRITSMPGYSAGLTAVERKMASQGYNGSGNMMAALQEYGGNAFNAEAARLAQLAGAQFAPSGAQALLQGNQYANDLAAKSLASLGYGMSGFLR
jgi:hypothetical protein